MLAAVSDRHHGTRNVPRVQPDTGLAKHTRAWHPGLYGKCYEIRVPLIVVESGLWSRAEMPTKPARRGGEYCQAVATARIPSSAVIRSRMMNFCILPVTVIGNSSTKRICRGTL